MEYLEKLKGDPDSLGDKRAKGFKKFQNFDENYLKHWLILDY